MVDDLRAAAADSPVDGRVLVQFEQVRVLSVFAVVGFLRREPFAGLLDHFAICGDRILRVHAVAVDLGGANGELEAGKARVDARRSNGTSDHFAFPLCLTPPMLI